MQKKHMLMAILIGFAIFTLLGVALTISYGPNAYLFYTFFDTAQRQALKTTLTRREIIENFDPKGFQIGDPGRSKRIRLYLFADADHDLEISIATLEFDQLKQTDIDKIIASFKKDV